MRRFKEIVQISQEKLRTFVLSVLFEKYKTNYEMKKLNVMYTVQVYHNQQAILSTHKHQAPRL